jgi:hypothetical protein
MGQMVEVESVKTSGDSHVSENYLYRVIRDY